jgi:hypothetical protein
MIQWTRTSRLSIKISLSGLQMGTVDREPGESGAWLGGLNVFDADHAGVLGGYCATKTRNLKPSTRNITP